MEQDSAVPDRKIESQKDKEQIKEVLKKEGAIKRFEEMMMNAQLTTKYYELRLENPNLSEDEIDKEIGKFKKQLEKGETEGYVGEDRVPISTDLIKR